jgi:hypothetical protein
MMKKEDLAVLAQLLTAMKDAVGELEDAQRRNDSDRIMTIKKEILSFQKKIDELT